MGDNDDQDAHPSGLPPLALDCTQSKGFANDARTLIRFDIAKEVSGGINRIGGSCTRVGDKLTIGSLRAIRMAGPPALMDQ